MLCWSMQASVWNLFGNLMYFTIGTLPKFCPLNNMYLTTLDYFFKEIRTLVYWVLGTFLVKLNQKRKAAFYTKKLNTKTQ